MTATAMPRRNKLFRDEEPEWLVWLLVAVMLGIGLIAMTIVVNDSTTYSEGGLSVTYPATWTPVATGAPGAVLSVGESFAGALFPAHVIAQQLPVTDVSRTATSPGDLALKWSDDQAKDLLGYRVLGIEPAQVRGKDAVRVDYAYVAEPALATVDTAPIVARGADFLIPNGDALTVVRLLAESDAFDSLGPTWDRIIGSIESK